MTSSVSSLSDALRSNGKSFSGECFEGGPGLENQALENLKFHQCELKNLSLKQSSFEKCSFNLSSAHQTDFESCRIGNSSGSRYFFEECRFAKSVFRHSDFSGGALLGVDFTEAVFENSDFALCEFSGCRFDRARFVNCNFNASVFENTGFLGAVFENTTFKYVEGLTREQQDSMKQQGALVCPPVEIALREILKKIFFETSNPWLRHGLVALLFFCLGTQALPILNFSKNLFFLEANPLLTPFQAFQSLPDTSFFKGRLAIPNFDFSRELDHWIPEVHAPNDGAQVEAQNETFQSFPSALHATGFPGRLFYSAPKSTSLGKDPLESKGLWLPVDSRGEKLKLSFYYKNGHPQFRVYAKFKDGGCTVLSEINGRVVAKDSPWVYFSEGLSVPPSVDAVCLELSRFPEQEIFLDDVNLETNF